MVITLVEAAIALISLIDDICLYILNSGSVLAHPVRRRVVSILIDHEVLRRKELAESLAVDETVSQDDAEEVEIALHHLHLPKLDAELLIEYDPRNGDVVLWEDPENASEMLRSL